MASRVLHLRVSDEAIVHLLDAATLFKIPEGRPISSRFGEAIETIVGVLVLEAVLPAYPDGTDYGAIVRERIGGRELETPTFGTLKAAFSSRIAEQVVGRAEAEQASATAEEGETPLKAEIRKRVEQLRTAQVAHEVLEVADARPRPAPPKPDFAALKRVPFADLRRECPLDRFIIEASERQDPVMQMAIECVYAQLAVDHWGGPQAETLIRSTIKLFQKNGLTKEMALELVGSAADVADDAAGEADDALL